jgi:hypothetical protein
MKIVMTQPMRTSRRRRARREIRDPTTLLLLIIITYSPLTPSLYKNS